MVDSTALSLSMEPASHEAGGSAHRLLTDPGELLASLPALFGFYPEHSVVFTSFVKAKSVSAANDDTAESPEKSAELPHPLELGASFRLDVEDLGLLPTLGDYIETISPQAVFAFLIGDFSPRDKNTIVSTLRSALDQGILPLDGLWHTTCIRSGNGYQRLFGGAAPLQQDSGVIADIATTAAMQVAQERDGSPAITREELFKTFMPTWEVLSEEDSNALTESALQCFHEVMKLSDEDIQDVLRSVSEDAHLIVLESESSLKQGQQGRVRAVGGDDLRTLATYLLAPPIRDVLLPLAVDYPSAVRTLALHVARNSSGDIRTNALCWFAVAATADGLINRAFPALITALDENPEHPLSSLLIAALRLGRADCVIQAAEKGRT